MRITKWYYAKTIPRLRYWIPRRITLKQNPPIYVWMWWIFTDA